MGLNLVIACHRHRLRRLMYRGHEDGVVDFYRQHWSCNVNTPGTVVLSDDQARDQWLHDEDYEQEEYGSMADSRLQEADCQSVPKGQCPTGKRVYYQQRLANRAISIAANRGELEPLRHYACPWCGWWHLSRKPQKRTPTYGARADT